MSTTDYVDPLDMSPEEFAAMDLDALLPDDEPELEEEEEETSETTEEEESESDSEGEALDEELTDTDLDEEEELEEESEHDEEEQEKDESGTENQEFDFAALGEAISQPFKANGKQITVNSAEDAIRLMQMGVGANKRNAQLKPMMRVQKQLQDNGMFDEAKLNMAIDLMSGNKEAITSLIKQHKIDPYELDMESEKTFTPKSYEATDEDVELSNTIQELRGSDKFDDTIKVIGSEWDERSSQAVSKNPAYLRDINSDMESGSYEQIKNQVEYNREMGRIDANTSDLEAYGMTRGAMMQAGQIGNPYKQQAATRSEEFVAETKPSPLKKRKKAMSSTRGKGKSSTNFNDIDVNSLTKEEFDKVMSQYL